MNEEALTALLAHAWEAVRHVAARAQAAHPFVQEACAIWKSGGWGMLALAVDGMVIFTLGLFILFQLTARNFFASPKRAWRRWERNPAVRGVLSRIIGEAMACGTLAEMEHYFAALINAELAPIQRDLQVMKVSVTAAPLLGLLGTVTGMLTTFKALASGGGGEKTMGMIASGISEALITTETGLVLALSGLMFQFALTRQQLLYGKRMAQVESMCMQAWQRGADGTARAA